MLSYSKKDTIYGEKNEKNIILKLCNFFDCEFHKTPKFNLFDFEDYKKTLKEAEEIKEALKLDSIDTALNLPKQVAEDSKLLDKEVKVDLDKGKIVIEKN